MEQTNDKIGLLFDNWSLLRLTMAYETEDFLSKNEERYPTKQQLQRALREHIDRKFKDDSNLLFDMKMKLLDDTP